MRYEIDMVIDAPRERVLAVMLDQSNLKKWQPDLIRMELLSGEPGEVGTKTLQVNRQGKRELEIVETITVMNPPEEVCATYEAEPVWNLIENRFEALPNGNTHWTLVSEFRTTSIFMKLMTIFASRMFKKQTRLFMARFKAFVEAAA